MIWAECLWEDASKAGILFMEKEEERKGLELKS